MQDSIYAAVCNPLTTTLSIFRTPSSALGNMLRCHVGIWSSSSVKLPQGMKGTFVAIVPGDKADFALRAICAVKGFGSAACIGTVETKGRFPLVLETAVGGTRPVEVPPGEMLPRIC